MFSKFLFTLIVSWSMSIAASTAYDKAPVLESKDILSKDMLSKQLYSVEPLVSNDGFLNRYTLKSEFGSQSVLSTPLLHIRINELQALTQLSELSKTKVFLNAAKDAGVSQVVSIGKFIRRPIKTVAAVPSGLLRWFKSSTRRVKDLRQSKEAKSADTEESKDGEQADVKTQTVKIAERFLRITAAERKWAQKLNVDPYSRNELLAKAINTVARVDRLGAFSIKLASIPGNSMAVYTSKMNQLAWYKNPYELKDLNTKKLESIELEESLIIEFLSSRYYSPSSQTLIVSALLDMEGVDNRAGLIEAALTISDETGALFYLQSVLMLAAYHKNHEAFGSFITSSRLPVAISKEGALIALASVDYIFWTESTASTITEFNARLSAYDSKHLLIRGDMSPLARENFKKLGWTLMTQVGMGFLSKETDLR